MNKFTNCTFSGDHTIPATAEERIVVVFPADQWAVVCAQPITLENLIIFCATTEGVDAMLKAIPLRDE